MVWAKGCYKLAGVTVRTFGKSHRDGPVLTVANHVSYLDIPILAALIDGAFVAKSEVGSWPLFGTAARITGTVFVNRSSGDAMSQREELTRRLNPGGRGLILFAEGTSTDGSRVAPFKTSLLGVAERPPAGRELVVQPASIAYPRDIDGRLLTGARRSLYCWYGDAALLPHMWRMMGLRGAEAEVRFHTPIRASGGTRRKELARTAEAAVASGVAEVFAFAPAAERIAAA